MSERNLTEEEIKNITFTIEDYKQIGKELGKVAKKKDDVKHYLKSLAMRKNHSMSNMEFCEKLIQLCLMNDIDSMALISVMMDEEKCGIPSNTVVMAAVGAMSE